MLRDNDNGRVFGRTHLQPLPDGTLRSIATFIRADVLEFVAQKFLWGDSVGLPSFAFMVGRTSGGELDVGEVTTVIGCDGVGIQVARIADERAPNP